jgi:hypothetical protein
MYFTVKHKTPWDFGGVFTPISCPMKNPMGEKNSIEFFVLRDYNSHIELIMGKDVLSNTNGEKSTICKWCGIKYPIRKKM